MATALKTQKTSASVKAFLDAVPDAQRRTDARAVSAIMQEITGEKPAMWGTTMVGFGTYHYRYASGQEGDWPLVAFAPRKDRLTLYLMPGFANYRELLGKLGPHSKGMSCLHIKSLDKVHLPTLKTLVRQSVKDMKKTVRARAAEQKRSTGAVTSEDYKRFAKGEAMRAR
ncbi:MAG TPA: DUF1801 domain-containing protein [Gemmatimonadaceae bacterium]